MGFAKMWRAEYRARTGTDPLPDYAEALSDFSKVLETERHQPDAWTRRAQLYYLRARGLPESQAKRLIIDGFLQELAERTPEGPVRDRLSAALDSRLRPYAVLVAVARMAVGKISA